MKAEGSLKEFNSNLDDKVKEVEKGINGNQLAILSIFAGIVTTFIGGFGVSLNIFSNLINKVPLPKIIVASSILLIGMSCVIFLLMTTAAHIIHNDKIFSENKKILFSAIRVLALICLVAALMYQLEFSKTTPVLASQGIWFEQCAKIIEIFATIFMIAIVIVPKPIFKLYRWFENIIRDWLNLISKWFLL